MKAAIFLFTFCVSTYVSSQHLTGNYVSTPQMENFEHFKIYHKQHHLEVKAFISSGELWSSVATKIEDVKADYLIKKYGKGEDVKDVYELKVLLDGLDWKFYLLAFIGDNNKNNFIVIEEIYADETEKQLMESHQFQWLPMKKG